MELGGGGLCWRGGWLGGAMWAMGAPVRCADEVGLWKGGWVALLVCGLWGAWIARWGEELAGRRGVIVA